MASVISRDHCRAILFSGNRQIAIFGSGDSIGKVHVEIAYSYLHLTTEINGLVPGYYRITEANPTDSDPAPIGTVSHKLFYVALKFDPSPIPGFVPALTDGHEYDGDGDVTITITVGGTAQVPPLNIPVIPGP